MEMNKQQTKSKIAKEKIVVAATKLFNEYGVDGVGIREICEEAGVTTGTFYHHYKTKTDIFSAIYDNHEDRFETIFNELCKKPPYCNGIVSFFTDYLGEYVQADGVDFTMHRLFVMKKHSSKIHKLYQGMEELINKAVENGELSSDISTDRMINYFFTVFRGTTYEWCIISQDSAPNIKDMLQESMTFAVRSFTPIV